MFIDSWMIVDLVFSAVIVETPWLRNKLTACFFFCRFVWEAMTKNSLFDNFKQLKLHRFHIDLASLEIV